MLKCLVFLLVAMFPVAYGISIPGLNTTEPFDHVAQLDERGMFTLFWNFNSTHNTLEAHVETKGW
ncbi:hypothetical protein DPMN_004915 [Dreissena polymorpha]|uniref:Uncharacterized protein n=1 Tax=Dreissena polymorpha TaxID=45954 RepID=A0A9D4MTJ6_DREPO|nr:hypothetical protein DPMN_004915 [Dreissena polymorpha]